MRNARYGRASGTKQERQTRWRILLLLLAVPVVVAALSTGPDPGHTGAPFAPDFGRTCTQCHGTTANSGPGSVAITDLPSSYVSAGSYTVRVAVSDPNQRRWGFQLSARTQGGQQAGTLLPSDATTKIQSLSGIQYIEHTNAPTTTAGAGFTFAFTWQAPDVSTGPVTFYVAANAANGNFSEDSGDRIYTKSLTVPPMGAPVFTNTYYFPHLALGGGWQTTITYINYSPQSVTCETTFLSDSGGPLAVSFGGAAVSTRPDTLGPGQTLHQESTADLNAPTVSGWARTQCTGPIKAGLLFRFYQQGAPLGEASVNAMTAPATKFVTFADQRAGVAYANPSSEPATITLNAISSAGAKVATRDIPLLPGAHGAANIGPLLGLSSFTGSLQVVSAVPIVSLGLNAEAFPVFSALPPGELDASTVLVTGDSGGNDPMDPSPDDDY